MMEIEGRVYNSATNDISYAFTFGKITQTSAALTINERTQGRLATAGSSTVFDFDLASDSKLLFDNLIRRDSLKWSLSGPRGHSPIRKSFGRPRIPSMAIRCSILSRGIMS